GCRAPPRPGRRARRRNRRDNHRRPALSPRPPRARPHHPDRRREADEQLPALTIRLQRALPDRHPVARFRPRDAGAGSGRVCATRAPLRGPPRPRGGRRLTVEAKTSSRPAWRPSPLMVRILFGSLLVAAIMGLVLLGLPGLWVLVLALGGLALWEFGQISDHMGFRAPSWLLYPLGAYLAFSGTLLKAIDLPLVLSIALVAGLAAFLFLPGQRDGLGRWAMGLAGAIYIGLPMNYYLLLYTSAPAHGRAWVMFTVLTAAVSDIAALLIGGAIGRTPFFPA